MVAYSEFVSRKYYSIYNKISTCYYDIITQSRMVQWKRAGNSYTHFSMIFEISKWWWLEAKGWSLNFLKYQFWTSPWYLNRRSLKSQKLMVDTYFWNEQYVVFSKHSFDDLHGTYLPQTPEKFCLHYKLQCLQKFCS